MSEENNKPDDELEDAGSVSEESTEDEVVEEVTEGEEESVTDEIAGALAGMAAAAATRKGGKKPTKAVGKTTKGKTTKPKAPAAKTAVAKPKIPAGTVDINAEVEKLQGLADKNKVWTVAGYSFTPAKLMILGTILSTALGSLYGAFEVYKDYQDMKVKIAKYVAPDLSEIYKKVEIAEQNSEKSVQYTQDIKNDLKSDIRRLESVVDNVERGAKQSARESDLAVRDVQQELRKNSKETDQAIKQVQREVDVKIQKALDNPLAK